MTNNVLLYCQKILFLTFFKYYSEKLPEENKGVMFRHLLMTIVL